MVILDGIGRTFRDTATRWTPVLYSHVLSLFWLLAVIELAWSGIRLALSGADLQEFAGILTGDGTSEEEGLFQMGYLSAPGSRIAAGTDEILRNILAERVLGLPGDIRVDRDRPFSEVPSSTAS